MVRDAVRPRQHHRGADATPLFLCLVCEHANWTGSLDLFSELRAEIDEALRWIDEFGDLDGDRLLEYRRRAAGGLANHCWKDSWDGIPDERGLPLQAPVTVALMGSASYSGWGVRTLSRTERAFNLSATTPTANSATRTLLQRLASVR